MGTLYENIRKRRLELGLTQSELAEKLGYSDKSAIAHIEKGRVDLTQSKIVAFAKALNTSPGDLMGWEDPSPVDYYTDTDAFRDRMKDEYGVLFDLADKADGKQLKQIESIIRTIVGEDE